MKALLTEDVCSPAVSPIGREDCRLRPSGLGCASFACHAVGCISVLSGCCKISYWIKRYTHHGSASEANCGAAWRLPESINNHVSGLRYLMSVPCLIFPPLLRTFLCCIQHCRQREDRAQGPLVIIRRQLFSYIAASYTLLYNLCAHVRPDSHLNADFGSSTLGRERLFHVCTSLRTYLGTSGSTLQVHTLPDPTPIPTVFPHTAKHDGRYSDGIHKTFVLSYLIHKLSELRLVPRY